jgi:hypothetical protein
VEHFLRICALVDGDGQAWPVPIVADLAVELPVRFWVGFVFGGVKRSEYLSSVEWDVLRSSSPGA